MQAGDLAEHVEEHRKLARGELLFVDYAGADHGLFGSGFGAVGGDHHGFHGTRDAERDPGFGRGSEIGGAGLETGLLHAGRTFVDTVQREAAFGVAIDGLVLARDSRGFHRAAGRIEYCAVNGGFARAKPERQRQKKDSSHRTFLPRKRD